ncbi:Fibrillarin-domain-containing protein [Zopfia rhizophila CBS 207.26]|uniref:rRNA 2'-O-methyltransferase fibrillarin n=1 Tax=Zopfia rhizophila CBS 207.26 TaxID=1314779 RepID=A0A6A6EB21_9PEZI|nr:Fibrillarin-domain-containing protein [Zopfia rhizophila CBS 207.26]
MEEGLYWLLTINMNVGSKIHDIIVEITEGGRLVSGRGGVQDKKGIKDGQKTIVEPTVTLTYLLPVERTPAYSLTPGKAVYGENRIPISNIYTTNAPVKAAEYSVWDPFRNKLTAGIHGCIDDIFMRPGSKVLYLGATSGTYQLHEFNVDEASQLGHVTSKSTRDGGLSDLRKCKTLTYPKRTPAIALKYRMLVPMVDGIFTDTAQPDQARIVGLNAHPFLKGGGGVIVSIKAN